MKTKNKYLQFLGFIFLPYILSNFSYTSEDGHGDGHHKEKGHHDKHGEKSKTPKSLPMLWEKVEKNNKKIKELIKTKKLKNIHSLAPEIADLIEAMEGISKDIGKKNLKKLKGSIKRIKQVTDLLHTYSDKEDLKNTKKQNIRLEKLLTYVKSLYPKDTFKTRHHKEGHKAEQGHHNEKKSDGHHD